MTTDASDVGTGAMLSIGDTWETAQPVAYDSMQLNSAERNYPTHEKEMLAIIHSFEEWHHFLEGAQH